MSNPEIRVATVKLFFTENGVSEVQAADVDSNDIPMSLVVESLSNLVKGLSTVLVDEAMKEGISQDNLPDYLQGMINLDREKLKMLFK